MFPRGNVVSFWKQAAVGATRIGMTLPGFTEPYVTSYDVTGHLVEIRPPGGDGVIINRSDVMLTIFGVQLSF